MRFQASFRPCETAQSYAMSASLAAFRPLMISRTSHMAASVSAFIARLLHLPKYGGTRVLDERMGIQKIGYDPQKSRLAVT